MSGPSSPSPAGTMRAERANSIRGRSVSSCWGSVEEIVSVAEGDGAGDDREPQVEQRGPAARHRRGRRGDRRVPSAIGAAGVPVRAAIAVPLASGSRQPRAPGTGATIGLDDDVADVAGVAVFTVEEAAVQHDAAADAGGHPREVVPATRAAPRQPSPRARTLASLSTWTGRPTPPPGAPAGEVPPPGDVERRHRPPASGHRSADPTPGHCRRCEPLQRRRAGRRTPPRRAHRPARACTLRGGDQVASGGDAPPPDRAPLTSRASTLSTGRNLSWGLGDRRGRRRHRCATSRSSPLATRQTAVRAPSPTTPGGRSLQNIPVGHPGQARGHRAWSPRATSSSRMCRASARPAWPRRWPHRSRASAGCSSPRTCTDVVGRTVWNRNTSEFEFRQGWRNISCWPRSTEPHRRRSRCCSSRWPRRRSRWTERPTSSPVRSW